MFCRWAVHLWGVGELEVRLGECAKLRFVRILHMRQENGLALLTNPPHPHIGEGRFPKPHDELQSVFVGCGISRFEIVVGGFLKIFWSNGEGHLHLIRRIRGLRVLRDEWQVRWDSPSPSLSPLGERDEQTGKSALFDLAKARNYISCAFATRMRWEKKELV